MSTAEASISQVLQIPLPFTYCFPVSATINLFGHILPLKLGLKFISVPDWCITIVLTYKMAGTKLIIPIIMIATLSIVIIILISMHTYSFTLIPMRARVYHFNPLTPDQICTSPYCQPYSS